MTRGGLATFGAASWCGRLWGNRTGEAALLAVVMVLRGRFRQYWKSWLALSLLIAVAGGFALSAAMAGRRTAAAFPDYVARHGYDIVVYSLRPLPQLARLPDVASTTPVLAPFTDQPRCASCRKRIDKSNFVVSVAPPRKLPQLVTLLSGRMPHQTDPGEVLASFTLAQDNGVRIGSVIRVPLLSPSELATGRPDRSPMPRPALRVVGIIAAENEFPIGVSPRYDLYATTAFAAAVNRRAALLHLSYLRLRRGEAGLAGFKSRLRLPGVVGTDDLDTLAGEVQGSIRPQVIGWYVLAGLAALAALAVIGQAVARQAATERADQPALSALGLQPSQFALLDLLRALLIGAAGAAGAVAVTVCWQATAVTLVGIAVGVPVGIAAGKAAWRIFATNFGVVPVPVVQPLPLAALAIAALAAANVLAAVPALLAVRSHPGQSLRAE